MIKNSPMVFIDEKLHRDIKIRAAQEGVTIKVLVKALLEKALSLKK